MCAKSLTVDIDDSEVRELMEKTPRAFNSEFNRSFKATMGAFNKKFARERLRKGIVQVHRKISGGGRRQVFMPKKMRAFGFAGRLFQEKRLNGKAASTSNKSKVAKAHEYGDVVTPPPGRRFLTIRVKSTAAARRAGVQVERGQNPRFLRVRSVVIKARLGFFTTWRSFIPEANQRMAKSLTRATESALRLSKKARKRRPVTR